MARSKPNWGVVPNLVRDWYVLVKPAAVEAVKTAGESESVNVKIPCDGDQYVIVPLKVAADSLVLPARMYGWAQKPFGGPHPLAASLVGAALGAAGGYGAGSLARWLLPEDYINKKRIRKAGLIGGAALGAGLPALFYGLPMVQLHGPAGVVKSGPFGPKDGNIIEKLLGLGSSKETDDNTLTRAVKHAEDEFGMKVAAFDDAFKRMSLGVAGVMAPTVPVDSLNRVIITDPYLSNPEKALFSGVGEAAASRRGGRFVSVADMAHITANLGLGAIMGGGIGRLGQAIGVLGPKGVSGLQSVGMIAGIARSLFG